MAKNMKSNADVEKNLNNKGNSRNFRKGQEPETYGEDDHPDDAPVDIGNEVGGVSDPNKDRGNTKDKSLLKPREPVLNAVPMPNKNKMNKKDYSVLDYTGDKEENGVCTAPADVPIGAVMRPNNIR